jgi:hypothetical protein
MVVPRYLRKAAKFEAELSLPRHLESKVIVPDSSFDICGVLALSFFAASRFSSADMTRSLAF